MTTTEMFLITIDSDREGSDHCREQALAAKAAAPICEQVADGIWTVEQAERFLLAVSLRDYVEKLIDDVVALGIGQVARTYSHQSTGSCVAKTLARCAFDDIDFHEVADHYLTRMAENAAIA